MIKSYSILYSNNYSSVYIYIFDLEDFFSILMKKKNEGVLSSIAKGDVNTVKATHGIVSVEVRRYQITILYRIHGFLRILRPIRRYSRYMCTM